MLRDGRMRLSHVQALSVALSDMSVYGRFSLFGLLGLRAAFFGLGQFFLVLLLLRGQKVNGVTGAILLDTLCKSVEASFGIPYLC